MTLNINRLPGFGDTGPEYPPEWDEPDMTDEIEQEIAGMMADDGDLTDAFGNFDMARAAAFLRTAMIACQPLWVAIYNEMRPRATERVEAEQRRQAEADAEYVATELFS